MDDDFAQVSVGASQLHLLIADYFMNEVPSDYIEIVSETQAGNASGSLWIVCLQESAVTTYIHNGIGYWVRPALLFTQEQAAYIRCYVGFSPESGKFLKLLGRSARSGLSVWIESDPVAHVLSIERMH